MSKQYLVHGAHDTTLQGTGQLNDGSTADVTYHAFVIELVPDNHDSGTLKLEYHGAEIAPAREFFTPGKSVTLTFS